MWKKEWQEVKAGSCAGTQFGTSADLPICSALEAHKFHAHPHAKKYHTKDSTPNVNR